MKIITEKNSPKHKLPLVLKNNFERERKMEEKNPGDQVKKNLVNNTIENGSEPKTLRKSNSSFLPQLYSTLNPKTGQIIIDEGWLCFRVIL